MSACKLGTDSLEHRTSGGSADSFIKLLSLTLEACSGACDRDDAPSCAALNKHVDKICGVDDSMCKKLCAASDSPSLSKATCSHK